MISADAATIANLENKDADWNAFDPEGYFQHYYGDPHPDDDALTYLAARALRSVACPSHSLDIVDVGTGPSLIPLLAALPVATRLTAWEYSKPNLEWLANELTGPTLRPQWQHFWQQVKAAHSLDGANASPMLPHDPLPPLVQRTRLLRGSIFDLPPRTFDAATMFFCAEFDHSQHRRIPNRRLRLHWHGEARWTDRGRLPRRLLGLRSVRTPLSRRRNCHRRHRSLSHWACRGSRIHAHRHLVVRDPQRLLRCHLRHRPHRRLSNCGRPCPAVATNQRDIHCERSQCPLRAQGQIRPCVK